jgi:hypothetical protein
MRHSHRFTTQSCIPDTAAAVRRDPGRAQRALPVKACRRGLLVWMGAVLHEIRHAMFAHEMEMAIRLAELPKRVSATAWRCECCSCNARIRWNAGCPTQAVRSKRAMGVFLGQAVIAEITSARLWTTETNHSRVIDRFAPAAARRVDPAFTHRSARTRVARPASVPMASVQEKSRYQTDIRNGYT